MMLIALLVHLFAIPAMFMYLLVAVPAEGWRHCWKRLPLFLLLWLGLSLLNLVHMCGHLLDEILFRRYRKTTIQSPVFILGIPRSGTTFLQRLLDNDERFTTLTTWEAILAPSITERYCYRALGWLLTPIEKGIVNLRRKLFHTMDGIHRIRLQEPEEDFLLLMPLLACLLFVFVCPGSRHFWRLGSFDSHMPAWYKKQVMHFYTRCLQKHLYYQQKKTTSHHLQLLSKNPSFTSMTQSLLTNFPDARIIACSRAPTEVIPSQLSSLRPAMNLLGVGRLSQQSQNRMIALLHHYYAQLQQFRHDQSVVIISMTALQSDLKQTVSDIFAFLSLQPSPAMVQALDAQVAKKQYRSRHKYTLAEFSLHEEAITATFRDVWAGENCNTTQQSRPA